MNDRREVQTCAQMLHVFWFVYVIFFIFYFGGGKIMRFFRRKVVPLITGGEPPPPPDTWVIEVNDITNRWERIDESDLRSHLSAAGVLVHPWDKNEGLGFEPTVRILQEALNHRIFEKQDFGHKNKLAGRPLRIRNIATDDFIPLEGLGIVVEKQQETEGEGMSLTGTMSAAQMAKQLWGSGAAAAGPLVGPTGKMAKP